MNPKTLYVSEVISQIKHTLDNESKLQNVSIVGELSNVTVSNNKHWYFTLKDAKARLACVMFANRANLLKTPFKEGDEVMILGRISLYEAGGNLQCYVMDMQLYGVGNLYIQLELTRKKLAALGYFDESKKQALPLYPMRIGLVTSKETAAYHDVVSTLKRRWPFARLVFHHSQVQGVEAPPQLIRALTSLDAQGLDVIMVVRGGGSIEDLWAFNDEALIQFIASMKTPLVSGVGHESDITLIDYVADKRAPTPTGAAELITPSHDDVSFMLLKLNESLASALTLNIEKKKAAYEQVKGHYFFKDPHSLIQPLRNEVNLLKGHYVFKDPKTLIQPLKNEVGSLKGKLIHQLELLLKQKDKLIYLENSLIQSIDHLRKDKANQIKNQKALLKALSYESALLRGYSITYLDGKIINSITDIEVNTSLKTQLSDGFVYSRVESIKENNHE